METYNGFTVGVTFTGDVGAERTHATTELGTLAFIAHKTDEAPIDPQMRALIMKPPTPRISVPTA